MSGKLFSLAFAAAMFFVAAGVFAADPYGPFQQNATQSPAPAARNDPAANLGGQPTAPAGETRIRQWFVELTDTNPSVRDRARVALMGIDLEELGTLRSIVDSSRPLAPAQAAVLHDVVVHVYVAGNERDRNRMIRRSGFLGVLLEQVLSGFGPGRGPAPPPWDENQPEFDEFNPSGGVLIRETWPGFAGFRFLRVGDIVVGTGAAQRPHAPTVQELRASVQATPPGLTLPLRVLRQGRVMEVPVRVGARPAWAEDEFATRQMQSRRLRRAEIYWKCGFAPLLLQDDRML